jgi:hypothetical protein
MKFQLLQTGDQRMYVGFMNGSIKPTGETPLQDQAGFLFGVRTGNLNFVIIYNDITGTQNVVDTGIPVDALLHTVMIDGNTANGWRYKLDQAAWSSYISTDTPASSYVLNLAFNMENTVATTKDMYHYLTHIVTDK